MIGDAARLQVAAPWIDPDVVGRAVQHPVGARSRRHDVEEQLDEDVADRLRARGAGLRGDQRPRDAMAKKLLVGRGAMLRFDEVPPPDLFVFRVPPLAAGRDDLPHLRAEERKVIVGEVEVAAEEAAEVVEHDAHVVDRARRTRREIHGVTPVPAQLAAGRVDQVVRDGSGRPVGDPAHRVGDVTVEAREEPKPVLAGQILAAVLARPRHGKAPRLAAGDWKKLVDLDVEVALDQLMRGAEPRDAAAEDDDLRIHGSDHSHYVL